ncbi:MAG: hypothetical protein Q8L34_02215 [Candidatus Woesearchaeota archaeon]|nr:hypothetical protein [Candidatus Woesearchaeota archaeon]
MTKEDLEKRTTDSGDDGVQGIIHTFVDQPKAGPLPLDTLAKSYGLGAERFARDLMEAYRRRIVKISAVPREHPDYEFQHEAARRGEVV